MLCQKCGQEIDNDSVFCIKCGEPIFKNNSPQNSSVNPIPINATNTVNKYIPSVPKKKKSGCLIAVIICAVLLVILISVAFALLIETDTDRTTNVVEASRTESTISSTTLPEKTEPKTEISSENLAMARESFKSGEVIYLYDLQPNTVSKTNVDETEFTIRYITSKDAQEVPNCLMMWRVNAEGVKEYIIYERASVTDWKSETGTLTFYTVPVFSMMRDQSQYFIDDPNSWVLQAYLNMKPIYGGPNKQIVTNPTEIYIFLLAPLEDNGKFYLTDTSKQLSNTVQIPIK